MVVAAQYDPLVVLAVHFLLVDLAEKFHRCAYVEDADDYFYVVEFEVVEDRLVLIHCLVLQDAAAYRQVRDFVQLADQLIVSLIF